MNQSVSQLIEKLKSHDSDYRFMALNDINSNIAHIDYFEEYERKLLPIVQ